MNIATPWQVPLDHPAFAGHFPGTPIVPGVLLLDAVIHAITTGVAGAPVARCDSAVEHAECMVRSVKFLSPVRPGDALVIHHQRRAGGVIHFEILAGSRKVAVGDIALSAPQTAP
jgi:3-hydroxyacyl-[acyl-carrier-protein] dehydratase